MATHIYVQNVRLPSDQDSRRSTIDWESLDGTRHWKALSWVRNKPTWIEPTLYTSLADHPNLATSLILLKHPDQNIALAIYPVSTFSANNNLTIEKGIICSNTRRIQPGGDEHTWVVCVEATGIEQERDVVKQAVQEARKLVGSRSQTDALSVGMSHLWNGIGICTWESLRCSETRPNKDLLLSLVPSFPITTYLIDDGWQDIVHHPSKRGEDRFLNSFEPWSGFGAPIQQVVNQLKERGVKEVGVWLTLQGYWGGLSPESHLIGQYNCQPHKIAKRGQPRGGAGNPYEDSGDTMWLPHPDRAKKFWLDWFSKMKSWGIGFVKVDNQAGYDALIGIDAASTMQSLWSGVLEAVVEVWGSLDRIIMCMSHNERMLNGPGGLNVDRPHGSLTFRNSDDFNISPNPHANFIKWNVYSTILNNHLSLTPDFDMFASNPADLRPLYHALLRALGPGPTLLSDTPDIITDTQLLDRMIAKDRSGVYKAVKTITPVQVPHDRWFLDGIQGQRDGPALLASTPISAAQGALIGVWNVRDETQAVRAKDRITIMDVEDALGRKIHGEEYAVWAVGLSKENGRKVELATSGWKRGMELDLETAECELVVVAKVWSLKGRRVAVVGMLDKLAPLAGLDVKVVDDQLVVRTRYHAKIWILAFGEDHKGLKVQVDESDGHLQHEGKTEDGGAVLYSVDLPEGDIMDENWEVKITAL